MTTYNRRELRIIAEIFAKQIIAVLQNNTWELEWDNLQGEELFETYIEGKLYAFKKLEETELTLNEIIKIVKEKEAMHRKKYQEFVTNNPGYVMNGHSIKAETCKEILEIINKPKLNITLDY